MRKNKSLLLIVAFLSVGFMANATSLHHLTQSYHRLIKYSTPLFLLEKPEPPQDWFHLDENQDQYRGVSTNLAYQYLQEQGRTSQTIVVAIIDSGIDIEHEDLKEIIWVNEDEIPDNGKDDDGNGYVDDINGWNFIGGPDGSHVDVDSYELTREYVRLKDKYEGKTAADISKKEKEEFEYFLEIKKAFQKKVRESEEEYEGVMGFKMMFDPAMDWAKETLGKDEITAEDIASLPEETPTDKQNKAILSLVYDQGIDEEGLNGYIDYLENSKKYGYNEDFDPRDIVGDNYADVDEKYYGNNDVIGPDAEHGTHVAGIVAAIRNNDMGAVGIADNVKIMVLRTVPNGDERDKDVANSIYYAVDNGAQIINMSFGKSYSPQKSAVDKAVQYAMKKGVLIIHAAGNDSENIDEGKNFPTKNYLDGKKRAENWLEIGASSWGGTDNFVADFSNYGKVEVDVFAPGVDIYSTVPGQEYKNLSGTSMAAPVTTGVAALLMSYYPNLSAEDVKKIIIESAIPYDMTITLPTGKEGNFSELSVTGAIVNAYEAVKRADEY